MDHFDELVETFQGIGLSEAQARLAAIGREGNESQARAYWQGSDPDPAADAAEARAAAIVRNAMPMEVRETVAAAQQHLHMTEERAREYAVEVYEREARRIGVTHALNYMRTFSEGLRTPLRQAAKR